MTRVLVRRSYGGCYVVGETFYQVDFDFPRAAERAGWSIQRVQKRGKRFVGLGRICRPRLADGRDCKHFNTDGTVACPCGAQPSDFIRSAADYLDRIAS